ncbi:MAG TPA: FAD synthetase family protein [Patescibacteria group bacterium]|nr:FAD synthetase family protein [Patescibacteria group bacterium]
MRQVLGRAGLITDDGPLLVAVGVFDGLHLGHAWLLDHVVREARARAARPAVITFDAHPDAVLLGHAPPLLMDPAERLERLSAAGIDVVVVEHFDDALRRTPYDAFIRGILDRCPLVGIVMTPDAAFGHERAGTPSSVAELGDRDGFEVVVVPPFALDGREVRSSDIRVAISGGDLALAERLLGRPYAMVGAISEDRRMTFPMPVAMPPPGTYRAIGTDGRAVRLMIEPGSVTLSDVASTPWVRMELVGRVD